VVRLPSRPRLRRFTAVGLVATLVDVALLVVFEAAGVTLLLADVVALVSAAAVSYLLHRAVTFGDDPFVRWMHHIGLFAPVVVLAGLVDLLVLTIALGDSPSSREVLGAKLLAVAVAGAVRVVAYRSTLFRVVRREQDAPSGRRAAAGAVRLSVVVPAFHEEARIATTIARLREALADVAANGAGLEIVVVDDGSKDATADNARAAGADQVIVLEHNRGKGGAVRAGVLAARGRTIAFTDADLAYDPAQLVGLLERVEAGWDVVVGNRRHDETDTVVRAVRLREVGSRLVNVATMVLLLGQYRDTQCGLKAFRADVGRLLFASGRIDGFAFDIELFHLIERHRLSLAEVPVAVENSERSTVRAARDGLRLLTDLWRVRRWARRGVYALAADELPPRAPTGPAVADAR
jgi:dolichyl-phosphate beta-glucosyltransferase